MVENHGTVHEIAEDGHKLIVVARLEILPGEVVVLGLGCIGREHVAQHVLLAGEVAQIFVEPYRPVAGGGYLVVLEIQEFVGGNIVGKIERTVGHEHGGENDAMEHYIVLADEMDHAGILILPPFLVVIANEVDGV